MAKKKIKEIIEEILEDFLEERDLFLWNVEFVKEAKDWFLRVYIDKKNKDEYLDITNCEDVSRYLSEQLDELDPIEQNYYMEVSSPGMDRELINDNHLNMYIESLVDIKLYKALNGSKEITAKLLSFDDETLNVLDEKDMELSISRKDIAKIRLTIVF